MLLGCHLDELVVDLQGVGTFGHLHHGVFLDRFGVRTTNSNRAVVPHIVGLIQLDLGIHVALGMHDDLLGAGLVLEAEEVGGTAVALHRPRQEPTLGLVRRQRPWRGVGAVVQAAHDQRPVRVAVEEHHHHFVAYTWDLDAAEAAACTGLGDTYPAGAVIVVFAIAVPVELDLHPAQFVGEDLLTRRADDDRGLRAGNGRFGRTQLRAERDLLAHATEGVEVAGLLAG
ncbi:hypothetical protein D9M71_272180 [compost metagenome]